MLLNYQPLLRQLLTPKEPRVDDPLWLPMFGSNLRRQKRVAQLRKKKRKDEEELLLFFTH